MEGGKRNGKSADVAGRPARSDAQRRSGGRTKRPQGAQPSNRAPQKYMGGEESPCRVLRWAIDSLDLSYQGKLSDKMFERLEGLKSTAQAEDEATQATAQITIGNHLFAVAGYGRGRFRFVLTDERLNATGQPSASNP